MIRITTIVSVPQSFDTCGTGTDLGHSGCLQTLFEALEPGAAAVEGTTLAAASARRIR